MNRTLVFTLIVFVFVLSCKKSDDNNNGNSFIPNIAFDTQGTINTNLPQFSNLAFAGGSITTSDVFGFNGIVVYNSGNGNFVAFELTDPNHIPNNCSVLTVDGITATCNCDDGNSYNIVNGQPFEGTSGPFGLVPYFVEVNGNIIRVFNN